MNRKKVVIALGGNAIQSGDATAEAQQKALDETALQLVNIINAGFDIVITHGNGPQVGNLLLQQKAADSKSTPAMPLDTCGAMSEGMIGYWMQNSLDKALATNHIKKDVATIITRTEVELHDPAFQHPTKPIGPFYQEEEAKQLMTEQNLVFKEDAGRGWRRVVPSPKPVNILEHRVINSLVNNGNIVIAVGGGGIPVYQDFTGIHGVEAVIDKDFAAQKLAELVDADILLILTAVENVAVNYNKPNQESLTNTTVDQLKEFIKEGQFAPGSMLPKVEAAIDFAESREGRESIITSLDKAYEALTSEAGTHIKSLVRETVVS
ncbi:carbamate kinase [Bacillus massilinigeriensis]|uniref:carbamate kinase n=1 Tax=Bacillus massilionigeriensis TaxID=1805475 RepID=UPI00096AF9C4|nr:carbamate kinase [Bacillus massilionigeriensis]